MSNTFYEWVLGPSMAYTCAVFPTADATLEEAQDAKFDLVAASWACSPGMRLLDVGCGWGGMVLHAAHALRRAGAGRHAVAAAGEWAPEGDRARGPRPTSPRSGTWTTATCPRRGFDAVSSIGLTEHIGKANCRPTSRSCTRKLKPGGRLLNHCITRPDTTQRDHAQGGFINRYVFPDGELEGRAAWSPDAGPGFEVRHEENLREHYALTLARLVRATSTSTGTRRSPRSARHGPGVAALHGGSRLGFERNMIQLHQVLMVSPDEHGDANVPLRLAFDRGDDAATAAVGEPRPGSGGAERRARPRHVEPAVDRDRGSGDVVAGG